ncbi:hypothetical protein LuPra_05189 [Luteitalea pratensis]|uniref:Uncharacterized protein n=1 Tax=Luteitalea pratensis TaxID=1855912 RepID=A0A143PVV5_LUTPR|nr:hypothetical protein LuPra_05189 [Luteitalea pratensis]
MQQLKYKLRHRKPRPVNNVLTVLSVMLKKAAQWRVATTHGTDCRVCYRRVVPPAGGETGIAEEEIERETRQRANWLKGKDSTATRVRRPERSG